MKCETIYLREGRSDITLTTYIQEDSPEMLNGRCRPAVIVCPGGAYLSCSDREGEPVATQFAAMGYHAFVLRYGVYTEGAPGMFFPEPGTKLDVKEHCAHPNPIRDIARAMLEIRRRADEWLVDVNRIAVCGFSAGAHNCAMYATNWHKPVITEYFGKEAAEFRPAACILGYTLSDYLYIMKENAIDDPIAAALLGASKDVLRGSSADDDAFLAEISPTRNVTEYTPPTFLWATAEDALVPVQQTILMAKALADQKIPFEVHIFETGPHGYATATQASAMSKSNCDPNAAKWIPMCDAWLMKRFALDLPDLSPWEMG